MARIRKAQRALDRAHQHREAIEQLIADPSKCRGWFLDWADSQLRRDRFYIYSEKGARGVSARTRRNEAAWRL